MGPLRRNAEFMRYMPNVFFKKDPPSEFFWKVFSVVCQADFRRLYDANMDRIRHKIKKPAGADVSQEAKQIMLARKKESLRLLMALKRPHASEALIHLRKTATRQMGIRRIPVDEQHPISDRVRGSLAQPRQPLP